MFQKKLSLSTSPDLDYLEKLAPLVEEALREEGLSNPGDYLLRGGFHKPDDLNLILTKGSDYYGRPRARSYFGSARAHPHGIFLATLDDIGSSDSMRDPLWNALKAGNEVNAIVVFDSGHFSSARSYQHTEYKFLHPRKKLEALLGVVHLKLER